MQAAAQCYTRPCFSLAGSPPQSNPYVPELIAAVPSLVPPLALAAFLLAISLFVQMEDAIEGGQQYMEAVDPANLLTCILLVFPYGT